MHISRFVVILMISQGMLHAHDIPQPTGNPAVTTSPFYYINRMPKNSFTFNHCLHKNDTTCDALNDCIDMYLHGMRNVSPLLYTFEDFARKYQRERSHGSFDPALERNILMSVLVLFDTERKLAVTEDPQQRAFLEERLQHYEAKLKKSSEKITQRKSSY